MNDVFEQELATKEPFVARLGILGVKAPTRIIEDQHVTQTVRPYSNNRSNN